MAAVIVGGVIVIWLGLSAGRALLLWVGVRLHWPATLAAPLLLALIESLLFLAAVPKGDLLPEPQRTPALLTLIALAWVINGAVAATLAARHHRKLNTEH
ncbi:hypothetical protein CEK62_10390 [Alcanivorax sp. N3-2A]|nr:hypothetical protein CEK62_10390 [Alcanivorax sp. N3-2A]|tara:strand:+ start:13082 stop:13381 length:300 start_codon:yes stop_codon:yes gene_type:complete